LKKLMKVVLFIIVIAGLAVAAHYLGLGSRFAQLREWIISLGYWGPLVFIVVYTAAVTLLVPASALTITAGAVFGSLWGVIVVSIASTAGAALSFIIARYFARDLVEDWARKNRSFAKLYELTGSKGGVIVALTRLVPLFPYTLLNYGFGLTKVNFKTYIFWSWLCMLPGTVLYVVGGDAVVKTIMRGTLPWALIGVLAAVIALLAVLVRFAQKRLEK
jgi:uncharacterized membrane protein YdjX (TVP38/TMEM64 family)